MSSLKRVGISFLLVLGWMWIYRLPDGSALAEVKRTEVVGSGTPMPALILTCEF